jgi:hypothetical protein
MTIRTGLKRLVSNQTFERLRAARVWLGRRPASRRRRAKAYNGFMEPPPEASMGIDGRSAYHKVK